MDREEEWTGKKAAVGHLRVFGCEAYVHIPDACRAKLDPKSRKCLFLGYFEGSKAYRLFDLETKRIVKSRDVIFSECPLTTPQSYMPGTAEENQVEDSCIAQPSDNDADTIFLRRPRMWSGHIGAQDTSTSGYSIV